MPRRTGVRIIRQLPSSGDPNAQAQTLLPLIPAPNTGSGHFVLQRGTGPEHNWREELVRVDQNITDKDRFFFRFIHDSWSTVDAHPSVVLGELSHRAEPTSWVPA